MNNFILGFKFPFLGLRSIFSSPRFVFLACLPFVVDIILFWWGISAGAPYLSQFIAKALSLVFSNPNGVIYFLFYYPILIMFWLVFVAGMTGIVYLLASVVASPFNGYLAEQVLMRAGSIQNRPFRIVELLLNSFRMLWISIVRALLLISLSLILFALSFIPGINLVAAYLTFVIIAMDSADYSFEAKRMGLAQRFKYLMQHQGVFCGMGAAIGVITMIPGALILTMPFLVSGFAELMNEIEREIK